MKEVEVRITSMPVKGTRFVRIHSSYIISLASVQFDKTFSEVTISTGEIFPIGKMYRKNLDAGLEFL